MARQVRRVITGHDVNGRAIVTIDEVLKKLFTGRPGATACNNWVSCGASETIPPFVQPVS